MDREKLKKRLKEKGLKVTRKRLSILEAIMELNHPTTEEIIRHIGIREPGMAVATVYKALGVLTERKAISRVHTQNELVRYDALLESHHHLYCSDKTRIEDYSDEDLTRIIRDYLRDKKIPGFEIEDFRVQISGRFTNIQEHGN